MVCPHRRPARNPELVFRPSTTSAIRSELESWTKVQQSQPRIIVAMRTILDLRVGCLGKKLSVRNAGLRMSKSSKNSLSAKNN